MDKTTTPFLFFADKKSGPKYPLPQSGPLATVQTDLIPGRDEHKLAKFVRRDFLTVCRDGEDFDAVVRTIGADGVCTCEIYGEIAYPVDLSGGHIPAIGKKCSLVSAQAGRAVKPVRGKNHIQYFIVDLNPQKGFIFFEFPVRFNFSGRSIIFQ